ncbi:hypothetical protein D3C73_1571700 [compost metagenome]
MPENIELMDGQADFGRALVGEPLELAGYGEEGVVDACCLAGIIHSIHLGNSCQSKQLPL